MQCDADTVGSARPEADAEIIAMAVEGYAAAGLPRAAYALKINNRKLLNGLLDRGRRGRARGQKLAVLRAVDKLDRLGAGGRDAAAGRRAARTSSAPSPRARGWRPRRSTRCWPSWRPAGRTRAATLDRLANVIGGSAEGDEGLEELAAHRRGAEAAFGVGEDQARVRSLGGARAGVLHRRRCSRPSCWLETPTRAGEPVRFGSIGGGGRYDDLVARFTGERAPATGFSFGVSRLAAALAREPDAARRPRPAGRWW